MPLRGNSPPASRPVEERRQGNPFDGVPLDPSATTQRGGPACPPLWKHPPWGTGAGNPPATAKRPCPPPFCERGASPATTWLSVGRCPAIPNSQGAAAKREAESIRKCPQLFHAHMRLSGPNHRPPPGQTPVTGAASVPDEVRNAAARAFFSYTIKRRILFFLGKGHPTKAQRSGFCGEEEGQRSGMRDALPRRASRI